MSKSTNDDYDATLLTMENRLFGRLFDATKDHSQSMYAFMDHIYPHSNTPTINETQHDDNKISSTHRHSNEPVIWESHHLSNYCDNTQPLYNSFTDTNITPPHLNEPTIKETPDGNQISSTSPHSNEPTIQESPDSDGISITPPYSNGLPIQ
jgi:hypothetical protein